MHANEITPRGRAELKVASATQNVTVTTEPPLLQTDKADVHTDITARQIENLPIMGTQGGNFQALLRTIPGAGLTAETNSLAGNPQRAINANMNGHVRSERLTLASTACRMPIRGCPRTWPMSRRRTRIETVQVVTNSFDAEQGMAGGAAVNVQIKSGTNQFHGDAHEFHTRPEPCGAELLPDRHHQSRFQKEEP